MAKGDYPADWDHIAATVKEEAGWCCQNCGHRHDPGAGYTLTVHHLDGDPSNCDPTNLVALCQRCHLSIQARYHPGQLTLPGIPCPRWLEDRL